MPNEIHITSFDLDNLQPVDAGAGGFPPINPQPVDAGAGGFPPINPQPAGAGAGGFPPINPVVPVPLLVPSLNATVYVVLPREVLEVLKKAKQPTLDEIETIKKALKTAPGA
jgi:hypothetical protein